VISHRHRLIRLRWLRRESVSSFDERTSVSTACQRRYSTHSTSGFCRRCWRSLCVAVAGTRRPIRNRVPSSWGTVAPVPLTGRPSALGGLWSQSPWLWEHRTPHWSPMIRCEPRRCAKTEATKQTPQHRFIADRSDAHLRRWTGRVLQSNFLTTKLKKPFKLFKAFRVA